MNAQQPVPNGWVSRVRPRAARAAAVFALASVFLVAGCTSTPQKPQSMLDPQANFGAYRTFALVTGNDGSGRPTTIVDGYIHNAIAAQMQGKGYVAAPEGATPDLRIEYEAAKAEKIKNNPIRIGVGVGSYGSSGGGSVGVGSSSVKNVTEGSLVIHVIDSARNAEAWRSGVTRELGKGNVTQAAVSEAVRDAMTDLPARTAH